MGEPAVLGRAVPVLHACRNGDHIAGMEFSGLLAPLLIPTPAVGTQQNLSAALGRLVDVPIVPASGLKGDVGQEYRLLGVGEWFQIGVSDKILRERLVGRAQAEQPAVSAITVLIDLHCHTERRPGVGPSGVESQMGQNFRHLRLGDAVLFRCGQVVLK